jgi:hypothetical protein
VRHLDLRVAEARECGFSKHGAWIGRYF